MRAANTLYVEALAGQIRLSIRFQTADDDRSADPRSTILLSILLGLISCDASSSKLKVGDEVIFETANHPYSVLRMPSRPRYISSSAGNLRDSALIVPVHSAVGWMSPRQTPEVMAGVGVNVKMGFSSKSGPHVPLKSFSVLCNEMTPLPQPALSRDLPASGRRQPAVSVRWSARSFEFLTENQSNQCRYGATLWLCAVARTQRYHFFGSRRTVGT
jgi:hypothetical protein